MQNIKTINIRGKEYVDVATRVNLCNADEGFTMLSQERYTLADRHFFSVAIEVKGKQYSGDAEIKFNAARNTPDGTNPVECAQTSALGRALGFAGYGSLESIASADEVVAALAEQQAAPSAPAQPRATTPAPSTQDKALTDMLTRAKRRAESLGVAWDSVKSDANLSQVADTALVVHQVAKLNEVMREYERNMKSGSAA